MRFSNAIALLLLIVGSLAPQAHASSTRKHQTSTSKNPVVFAIEVLGSTSIAPSESLAREIATDSGSCAWSVVSKDTGSSGFYVGLFEQDVIAKEYAGRLLALGLITGFRIEPVRDLRAFTRARSVIGCRQTKYAATRTTAPAIEFDEPFDSVSIYAVAHHPAPDAPGDLDGDESMPILEAEDSGPGNEAVPASGLNLLPLGMPFKLELSSRGWLESNPIPHPNAAARAIYELTGRVPFNGDGGLWLSGDVDKALDRLRWILDEPDSDFITIDSEARVKFDLNLLCRAAGAAEQDRGDEWLKVAEYIYANEGRLLLTQLASSHRRYRLYVGEDAPTAGGMVANPGTLNLDNKYDSRINPHRKQGHKVPAELPPPGFDALVAMNPWAQWFNLPAKEMVPVGEILFHELAEARAKVELGFDYLPVGPFPGAHELALERERRLKAQRSGSLVVITAGQNILFKTQKELERQIEIRSLTGMQ